MTFTSLSTSPAPNLGVGALEVELYKMSDQTVRPGTSENDVDNVLMCSTRPLPGDSQGGITIVIAIRIL